MSSFSIESSYNSVPVQQWSDYLSYELQGRFHESSDDPLFLQKLGIVHAEHVRRTMAACAATQTGMLSGEIHRAGTAHAAVLKHLGSTIKEVGGNITSSLDSGFAAMNYSLTGLRERADIANQFLCSMDKGVRRVGESVDLLNRQAATTNANLAAANANLAAIQQQNAVMNANIVALGKMLSHHTSVMSVFLSGISHTLSAIATEQRVPEFIRERRFHVEQAAKYLQWAVLRSQEHYYEDALDELSRAMALDAKDPNVWYYLGYIHLYVKKHLNIEMAAIEFERFLYYADTTSPLWDEGCRHLAAVKYLQNEVAESLEYVCKITSKSPKTLILKAKYTSCLRSESNARKAVEYLRELLKKWPYAIMMVLEDNDIMRNPLVPSFINTEKIARNTEVLKEYMTLKSRIQKLFDKQSDEERRLRTHGNKYNCTISLTVDSSLRSTLAEIISLCQKNTLLDAIAAAALCVKLGRECYLADRSMQNQIQNLDATILKASREYDAAKKRFDTGIAEIKDMQKKLSLHITTLSSWVADYTFLANTIKPIFNHKPYNESITIKFNGIVYDFGSKILWENYNKANNLYHILIALLESKSGIIAEAQKFSQKLLNYIRAANTSTLKAYNIKYFRQDFDKLIQQLSFPFFNYGDISMLVWAAFRIRTEVPSYPGSVFNIGERSNWNSVAKRVINNNRALVAACRTAETKLLAYSKKTKSCTFVWNDNSR